LNCKSSRQKERETQGVQIDKGKHSKGGGAGESEGTLRMKEQGSSDYRVA
jgi:hypothetical protein